MMPILAAGGEAGATGRERDETRGYRPGPRGDDENADPNHGRGGAGRHPGGRVPSAVQPRRAHVALPSPRLPFAPPRPPPPPMSLTSHPRHPPTTRAPPRRKSAHTHTQPLHRTSSHGIIHSTASALALTSQRTGMERQDSGASRASDEVSVTSAPAAGRARIKSGHGHHVARPGGVAPRRKSQVHLADHAVRIFFWFLRSAGKG